MNKVSVVMACHNAERYVVSAVKSVLAQICVDIELIIIDDASTDATASLVASFLVDRRVRIINLPRNAGVSAARNAGLRAAVGSFIAFIDADDIWEPGKLAAQLAVLTAV